MMDSKYSVMGNKSYYNRNNYHQPYPSKGKGSLKRHFPFNNTHQPPKKQCQDASEISKSKPPSILEQRKLLPVFRLQKRLLEEIEKYESVIVIGETGCGKTTQIPQFLLNAKINGQGMIGVTQPRRMAAVTVAMRVAQEMVSTVGNMVGYTVRFEDVTSAATCIKFLTDGMLLREAMQDSKLLRYNIVILDEAHERTVSTDVLFGIVKQAQAERRDNQLHPLKVIVMSATMDVDHFSHYFGDIPVVYLTGRQYPVKVFFCKEPQEDYQFSTLVTIFQIHRQAPPNEDILVFLTGQEEIETMACQIRALSKDKASGTVPLRVHPLYAALSSKMQLDVFKPGLPGTRKVILSTNVAETSVTISGIKYVVDSGMVKARTFKARTGLDMLCVERISQAQAWQRTGRAGRESAGFCYRGYTKTEFEAMAKTSVPEIQRCNLAMVVLQLLALGINAPTFDFMDKPPTESMTKALEQLKDLGAVGSLETLHLTKRGRMMSLFPLDPRFSKIIFSAKTYGCVEEVLSVVALLSGENIFVNPPAKRAEASAVHKKFLSLEGDLVTLLNVYRIYAQIPKNKQKKWCYENFLNGRNLAYAMDVRVQLEALCRRCNIAMSSCKDNLEQLRKCLVTGLFTNVAELHSRKKYITVNSRQVVSIHPSSALFGHQPPLIVFTELMQTGRCYMRHITPIEPEWLSEIVPDYIRQHRLSVDKR